MKGSSAAAPAETVRVHQEDETTMSGIKDVPGIEAIASGSQVASGVSNAGSKVSQSALKLTNVLNPIYRDQSRKDQDVKTNPASVPPMKTVSALPEPDDNVEAIADPVVATPPVMQHLNAWDKLRQSPPPRSMTPDQQKMRGNFNRSSPSKK